MAAASRRKCLGLLTHLSGRTAGNSANLPAILYLGVGISSAPGAWLSSDVSSRAESEFLSAQVQLLEMVDLAGYGSRDGGAWQVLQAKIIIYYKPQLLNIVCRVIAEEFTSF
ncbi:hypothetical protein BC629DRAFT_1439957 [Irpex lacteus]|nr:hypothetical protein BC629DRAFT_1439957 [Irpex lacteus]